MHRILRDTITQDQSGPGINGNRIIFHTLLRFKTRTIPPGILYGASGGVTVSKLDK